MKEERLYDYDLTPELVNKQMGIFIVSIKMMSTVIGTAKATVFVKERKYKTEWVKMPKDDPRLGKAIKDYLKEEIKAECIAKTIGG